MTLYEPKEAGLQTDPALPVNRTFAPTGPPQPDETALAPLEPHTLLTEAETYLQLLYREQGVADVSSRLKAVRSEVARTGSYRHTGEELACGARVAWRNNPQCIGKFYWRDLMVRDMRHLESAEAVFGALVEHLRQATNGGKTRLMISVFAPQAPGRPGLRIWNSQLVRYAGYRQPDGSVLGDPANAAFTEVARTLGWPGGEGTRFDLLPLIIQMPGERPRLFELPQDAVLEVPLTHPDLSWFADLGLKWHAHPAISNTRLEIGGVSYTAAPFSAWYTCSEIGARNLSDVGRYNLLPVVARRMGLDTRSDRSLWKDRALLELTYAVLHSFRAHGVSILDHHAVTRQFVLHEERERQAGRTTPADWRFLVPPLSGSTTPIFERSYPNVMLKPNFFAQPEPWRESADVSGCPVH